MPRSVALVDWAAPVTSPESMQIRSLYVHVPFCERKCEYCDFASIAGMHGQARYVDALRAELRMLATALPDTTLDTVFVGGGTPGLLPPAQLTAIMTEVRAGFAIATGAEITLEANPSSTSEARAESWLAAGFNRVSIGVQSLDVDTLRFLGRVHGPQRAVDAVAAVRRVGFTRINTDLIYAVPGLDDSRWAATVGTVLELGCGHLSCYELTVEEGTPLHASVRDGHVTEVDPDTALRQHWTAVELAEAAGLRQYEVSNFARAGEECRHNLAYWRNRFYLAAGVGAHGHLPPQAAVALGFAAPQTGGAVRYWHSREPGEYVAAVDAGTLPVAASETLNEQAHVEERLMLGLRLSEGVAIDDDRQRRRASQLADAGLLSWDGTVARATRRGQEVLNQVVLGLLES